MIGQSLEDVSERVAVERMVSKVTFDAIVVVDLESVVTRQVREIAEKGHANRIEVVLPPNRHQDPSQVFFQPPAVIMVVISGKRTPFWLS
jgi:hypothetical protein